MSHQALHQMFRLIPIQIRERHTVPPWQAASNIGFAPLAKKYTIATLPPCNNGMQSLVVWITNGASAPTYLASVGSTSTFNRKVACVNGGWNYY